MHKMLLSRPGRYSEDIDLVQTAAGPIGALLDGLRARLDPWLGMPTRDQAAAGVTLLYRFESETPPVRRLRLKVRSTRASTSRSSATGGAPSRSPRGGSRGEPR